ncbi:uncharacterized protein LOC111089202 [Limulus polyphemus]|uniref:Uncharacterized protein LOC111089202 n=1 Tax=Limulus polyphemus TaxID=6850 RepID=A0ABM1TMA6_LIMPO|nr:uncharacterized protein LOC111089202 [Limulus polyphemus]XP_022257012.1 uncharacterized protein LOC111089202 [Limulus polyphemus]
MIVRDSPGSSGPKEVDDGFRVRYLGSVFFPTRRKKVNMRTLQKPLLDLYTKSRRRGEDQRSVHPLALTQHLLLSDYGLVVAENEEDQETGNREAVVTKVITPISGIIIWASVRFHTKILKRRMFGAAFVPLACSDAVMDKKSYVQLARKHRFLVSLTHPSLFVCFLRGVGSLKSVECHAFVCASTEDAMTICSLLDNIKQTSEIIGSMELFVDDRSSNRTSGRVFYSHNTLMPDTETPSIISHSNYNNERKINHQSQQLRASKWRNIWTKKTDLENYYENEMSHISSSPDSNKRYIRNSHGITEEKSEKAIPVYPLYRKRHEEGYNRSRSFERLTDKSNGPDDGNIKLVSCNNLIDGHFSLENRHENVSDQMNKNSSRTRSCKNDNIKESLQKRSRHNTRQELQNRSKSLDRIYYNDVHFTSDSDRNMTSINRCRSTERIENALSSSRDLPRENLIEKQNQLDGGICDTIYKNKSFTLSNTEPERLENLGNRFCCNQNNDNNSINQRKSTNNELRKDFLPQEHDRRHIWNVIQKHNDVHNIKHPTGRPERNYDIYTNTNLISEQAVHNVPITIINKVQSAYEIKDNSQQSSEINTRTSDVEGESDSQYLSNITQNNALKGSCKSDIDFRLEKFLGNENNDVYNHSLSNRKKTKGCRKAEELTHSPNQYFVDHCISNYEIEELSRDYAPLTSLTEILTNSDQKEEMELSETIDFSSESEYSEFFRGRREYVNEVFTRDTTHKDYDDNRRNPSRKCRKDEKYINKLQTHADVHESGKFLSVRHNEMRKCRLDKNSHGNTKITIKVPYQKNLQTEQADLMQNETSYLPSSVRTYNTGNNTKNWATLSQLSDSTCQGSMTYNGVATLPMTKMSNHYQKANRFSSDDHLQRRPSFLTSLKKFSLKSFNRAKKKLMNFRSKLREHLRGRKGSDCSEDSAYDTSEVCFSPQGNQIIKTRRKKKRQLSWSFHDLRSNLPSKNFSRQQHRSRSGGSALSGSSTGELSRKEKRKGIKHRRRRRGTGSSGSSDSGVEEYFSDYSGVINNKYKRPDSELENMATQVTLVNVKHGMSQRKFWQWSRTNLQDELGYIP